MQRSIRQLSFGLVFVSLSLFGFEARAQEPVGWISQELAATLQERAPLVHVLNYEGYRDEDNRMQRLIWSYPVVQKEESGKRFVAELTAHFEASGLFVPTKAAFQIKLYEVDLNSYTLQRAESGAEVDERALAQAVRAIVHANRQPFRIVPAAFSDLETDSTNKTSWAVHNLDEDLWPTSPLEMEWMLQSEATKLIFVGQIHNREGTSYVADMKLTISQIHDDYRHHDFTFTGAWSANWLGSPYATAMSYLRRSDDHERIREWQQKIATVRSMIGTNAIQWRYGSNGEVRMPIGLHQVPVHLFAKTIQGRNDAIQTRVSRLVFPNLTIVLEALNEHDADLSALDALQARSIEYEQDIASGRVAAYIDMWNKDFGMEKPAKSASIKSRGPWFDSSRRRGRHSSYPRAPGITK